MATCSNSERSSFRQFSSIVFQIYSFDTGWTVFGDPWTHLRLDVVCMAQQWTSEFLLRMMIGHKTKQRLYELKLTRFRCTYTQGILFWLEVAAGAIFRAEARRLFFTASKVSWQANAQHIFVPTLYFQMYSTRFQTAQSFGLGTTTRCSHQLLWPFVRFTRISKGAFSSTIAAEKSSNPRCDSSRTLPGGPQLFGLLCCHNSWHILIRLCCHHEQPQPSSS
jgi:hypothetical protein